MPSRSGTTRRKDPPDVPQCESRDHLECRYAKDTRYPKRPATLDEVFATEPKAVHLEQMNDSDWLLQITTKNGERLMVNIYAQRANVYAFAEWD